jgi:alcohol dehydrogenase
MELFSYYNPTQLIFGRGQVEALQTEVPKYGKRVLFIYGGGSIKRSGLYDNVMRQLHSIGSEVYELPGIEPNPRLSTVQRGVDMCRAHNIDFLLAVGGGSVIDCTKAIAAGAKYDGNVWDIITGKHAVEAALPLGTVLTLAATGSEMNAGSVITNWETQEKLGWGSPLVFPKFSILDPANTYTVPRDHTVYGMVDMMSHTLEHYFSHTDNVPLQQRWCEGLLRTVIETAPKILENLESYEARETLMYCGTMALNGTLDMGMEGDWGTHRIEHGVSAIYDIPHGGGLAIIFPNWMKYAVQKGLGVKHCARLAVNVFDIDPTGMSDEEVAYAGIAALREFWSSIGAPSRLADYKIDESGMDRMVEATMVKGEFGGFHHLNADDVREIFKMSL